MNFLPSLFDPSFHMKKNDLVLFNCCPVCGADYESNRNRVGLLQRDPIVLLYECLNCKAVSASHKPKAEVLDRYYEKFFSKKYKYFNTGSDVTFSDISRFSKHLRKMLSASLDIYLKNKNSFLILDYGGGDGALAVEFAKILPQWLMVEIIIVDYGSKVCNPNCRNVSVLKVDDIKRINSSVDFVIASASLEHVPDLLEVQKALWSLLTEGGFYYARTPYIMPIKRFIPLQFGYPAHVHDLGSVYWNRLSRSCGFDVNYIISRPSIIEVCFTNNPFRYCASLLLKLPNHIEARLSPFKLREYFWPFVGGWEVLLRKNR